MWILCTFKNIIPLSNDTNNLESKEIMLKPRSVKRNDSVFTFLLLYTFPLERLLRRRPPNI